ncbi:MAG TPA: hypothetical protein VFD33_07600 [Bacillota bacterium]|nr:hypothetical protein [Bacillota bacterium]
MLVRENTRNCLKDEKIQLNDEDIIGVVAEEFKQRRDPSLILKGADALTW